MQCDAMQRMSISMQIYRLKEVGKGYISTVTTQSQPKERERKITNQSKAKMVAASICAVLSCPSRLTGHSGTLENSKSAHCILCVRLSENLVVQVAVFDLDHGS